MSSNLPALETFDLQLEEDPNVASSDAEQRLRSMQRWTWGLVGLLIVALIVAATLVPIAGAVVAGGEVGVESQVKIVSHPTGGVVREVLVRDGDRVRAGQALIRFDTAVTGVSAESTGASLAQLKAQRARLEAEQAGLTSVTFPPDMVASSDPGMRAAMAQQRSIFLVNRARLEGMRAQLADRVRQYQQQIVSINEEIAALQRQITLIKPEREGLDRLFEKQLVTINRRNQLERQAVEMEGSIASMRGRIAQTRAQISETREQLAGLDQETRATAGNLLLQVNQQMNDGQIRSAAATDQLERSQVRAPDSGVVDALAFHTPGSMIPPAEPILRIVPDTGPLEVMAAIMPGDVDQVRVGQPARIRFTAFNMQTTPEVEGEVVFVSAERASDPKSNASFYRARIKLAPQTLAKLGSSKLRPGMPAEVFIQTGNRSLLSYILKPLQDQFARAFRDG